jgi:hypothetical protein
MVALFEVLAVLIALCSWIFVSQATAGVAGICFACFLLILARLSQAQAQHAELTKRLESTKAVGIVTA